MRKPRRRASREGGRPEWPGQLTGAVRSREQVVDLLDRITFTAGCPLPAYLTAEEGEAPAEVVVVATTRVRDRRSGGVLDVDATESLYLPISRAEAFARVIKLLDRVWMHELRESIQLDGVLVLDPHVSRRRA